MAPPSPACDPSQAHRRMGAVSVLVRVGALRVMPGMGKRSEESSPYDDLSYSQFYFYALAVEKHKQKLYKACIYKQYIYIRHAYTRAIIIHLKLWDVLQGPVAGECL